MRILRNLFCIFLAGFWTMVMFPVVALVMAVSLSQSAAMYWVKHIWGGVLVWGSGATLFITGREKVPTHTPIIFVANHQSTLDIPAIFVSLPGDFRAVVKKVLKYVPFLGWYLSLGGFIFIDRGNHREALVSLDRAATRIRNGTSVLIFAEGTRSADRRILPFKKGPFALAMKAGVPICPIVIEGSGQVMPKNSWNITPGPVRIAYGDLVDPKTFGDDRAALIRAVRNQMIDMSLALGGKGGDRDLAVAARGLEGIGRGEEPGSNQAGAV
ncbi:MAG: 1-acyl-sn-glycerol-3-phosphate acyltransferase [Myxococcaceae bacterium]|nr:1-acyl-sn-glycerol-3-phosphate acyltransferase [Myxococcaceae bacterium]